MKNVTITGGPGVGKTFLLCICILYFLSRGLGVALTANMSERALQLGGIHINKMFCIPVCEGTTVSRIAEIAITNLARKPKRLGFLRQMDVLAIDELGQVSAETLAVMDIVLRRVRCTSQYMGGVFVLSTMDPVQLLPVKGRPPLLSPHMLTCYVFHYLRHSVRAGLDKNLMRIQEIARELPSKLTKQMIREFKSLIIRCCNHLRSWNDTTALTNVLRVFGKKEAAKEAEDVLLRDMKLKFPNMPRKESEDSESTLQGEWTVASNITSRLLSKKVKEPQMLFFSHGTIRNHIQQRRSTFTVTIVCFN